MKTKQLSLATILIFISLICVTSCSKDEDDNSNNNEGDGNGCEGQTSIIYAGQTYDIVEIGDQCWMAENLNYETGNSWCYDNNPTNCATYGRMYDWETALGVCPSGWHLPSDDEWKILEGNVDTQYGLDDPEWDDTGWRGYDAGKRLKSRSGWIQNTGTDTFGFSALSGGMFNGTSYEFIDLGYSSFWWSSTEFNSSRAYIRDMRKNYDEIMREGYGKLNGYYIRCIKD